MKQFISWTLLLATMLFAACGGGEQPDDNPQNPTDGLSVTISGIVEEYTAISVKIRTTEATSYAYIADKSSLANSYTAQGCLLMVLRVIAANRVLQPLRCVTLTMQPLILSMWL